MSTASPSMHDSAEFVRALLASRGMAELAAVAAARMCALGCRAAHLAWDTDRSQEHAARTLPPCPADDSLHDLLPHARRIGERIEQGGVEIAGIEGACLLADTDHAWACLLYRRDPDALAAPGRKAEWNEAMSLLSMRCESLLQTEKLRIDVERLSRAERLQRALFAISDCASSDRDTGQVLLELHQIVGRLMYAKNFFIVRYVKAPETLQVVYFADSQDTHRRNPDEIIPAEKFANSLTLAMLRRGLPLHGPGDELRRQLKIERVEFVGPRSEDWLGVPMVENGQVRGGVVVQSYDPAVRYTYDDQTLLAYLAQNILTALQRREAAKEMERRVEERTLALRQEIGERQRSERLQAALFRIAEVAGGSGSMDTFYESIHGIVGALLDARNFYIALLNPAGDRLDFPFSIDEHRERFESRKLGHGLSEFVIRTGKPLLVDHAKFDELNTSGEVHWLGIAATCWLGVPLLIEGKPIGLIAVQSYAPDFEYSVRDEELLSFVSFHIANALERKRASESLREANLQLEHASQTDPLTGLHNRRYLSGQLPVDLAFYDRENERSGDPDHALVFAIVDIDHFKRINDSYGHRAGDRALQVFANVLRSLVQSGDYVVRWGGEEFLLVFRPLHRKDVSGLGERIRRRVEQHLFDAGENLHLPMTCSIGMAEYPLFRDSPLELGWEQTVEIADAALYWVKNNGRNGWAVLRPKADTDRDALLRSLKAGTQALIEDRQLQLESSKDPATV